MKNLFLLEIRKLLLSKSFYVCVGIMLAFSLLAVGFYYVADKLLKAITAEELLPDAVLPEVIITVNDVMISAAATSSFTMLMGIFTAVFICEDYNRNTIKNVYSHGFSRDQVFFAKMIVVAIATAAAYVLTLLFNFFIGLIFFGKFGEMNNLFLYLDQFLTALVYVSFVAFICFSFRKISYAVLFLLFAPRIFGMILSFIDLLIDSETFKLAYYWFNVFMEEVSAPADTKTLLTVGIGSIAYTALFTVLGWLVNRKHNI